MMKKKTGKLTSWDWYSLVYPHYYSKVFLRSRWCRISSISMLFCGLSNVSVFRSVFYQEISWGEDQCSGMWCSLPDGWDQTFPMRLEGPKQCSEVFLRPQMPTWWFQFQCPRRRILHKWSNIWKPCLGACSFINGYTNIWLRRIQVLGENSLAELHGEGCTYKIRECLDWCRLPLLQRSLLQSQWWFRNQIMDSRKPSGIHFWVRFTRKRTLPKRSNLFQPCLGTCTFIGWQKGLPYSGIQGLGWNCLGKMFGQRFGYQISECLDWCRLPVLQGNILQSYWQWWNNVMDSGDTWSI